MKTRKHPSSWLKELRSNFECGGCNIYFDSAYLLHDHMRDHVEGGSYYYNNTIQTAFPVSTTTEVATQTCPSDLDDIKVDKFVEFVANVKHEEGSDMDIYDDFDDWNEENDDENEAGKSKFTNNKTEKLKPNDRDRVPLSVTTGPMPGSKGKVVSNVVQTSKQKRKSSRPLKHSQANTNHYSEIAESFSKQSSLHIQDILVSLTRIDDVMKTKTTHESTVLNKNLVKRLHENDDGLTIRKYRKQRLLKRKKKLLRGKKNIMRKVNKGSDESGLSDDESDKSDPDYKPEWDPPESPVAFKDDNSEICEEDNDHNGDPHCKKARLECKNMKCEHCDKFIESAFSKANLLALHEIPFRQQNCCIYIKSRKALHKEHNGKVCHEENEMEFVIDKEAVKETFICDECGVICKDKNNFRRHKKIHKHSLTCPHCDFTPTSRKYFRIHMKTHKQKTDLRCDFCGSLFNHNKNLLRHVRAVHMGQKRYVHYIS